MPSTISTSVSSDFASSTVITPSLPTFCMAWAIILPILLSPLDETVPTWATSAEDSTFLARFSMSRTTAATARSMPRLRSIGFMPAATDLAPSRMIECASTVAVVVPSPAISLVFWATSRTIWAPMFSNLSSSSISLATVTPSLVMRGAPNDLSSTTLRPLGPSVTFTALARMSTPRSILSRASTENLTTLAAMSWVPSNVRCQISELRRQLTAGYELELALSDLFSLSSDLGSGEHAHDVGLFHDQEILAVELDLGTGPFSEQYLVADLEIDRDQLAGLVAAAGPRCKDLALLRLLACGVRNDDAAGGLLLGLDAFHDHPIVQGAELGFRHDDLVVAAQTAGFGLNRTGATLLALNCIECQSCREIWPKAEAVKRSEKAAARQQAGPTPLEASLPI